ncbi:uncharacterized protein J3D65DRAFT_642338 [Phyllosticta citribraziliensis]|uniref:CCR4-NOT transcription complex subunit 11 n=1 Tax=Phyllosticta citribraziliensis TaxID=989973 RepID=A0ABR1L2T8_9PEZI
MATSRPTPAPDALSTNTAMPPPSPEFVNFLGELLAHDRDAQFFPAIRDAVAKRKLHPLLQALFEQLDATSLFEVTEPHPEFFCQSFELVYGVFATDASRKLFLGLDPPPPGMSTKPTYATPFVTTVKLMQSIDALPQQDFLFPLQWSSIGLFHTLHCLYYIFELNAGTAIANHPALTLWVKSMIQYEHYLDLYVQFDKNGYSPAQLRMDIAYTVSRYLALNLELCTPLADAQNGSGRSSWSPSEFLGDWNLVYPNGAQIVTSKAKYFLEVLDSQGVHLRRQVPDVDFEPVQNILARIRGGRAKSNGIGVSQNGDITAAAESDSTSLESPAQPQDSIKPAPLQITPTNFDDILPRMDRADAHQLLVNLPLDIQSMETLNAVFARLQQSSKHPDADDALAPLNLDPTIIACGYIQHGLRQLERQRPATRAAPGLHDFVVVPSGGASSSYAGSSPAASATAGTTTTATTSSSSTDNANHVDSAGVAAASATEDAEQEEYAPADDAADTKRKITLLLLFMRNLIRKNIVGWPALQYDIQEICTRYSPYKEVRDFGRWIETGEEA